MFINPLSPWMVLYMSLPVVTLTKHATRAEDPKQLETELLISFTTNVIGHIHLFNFALPLVLKGNIKKVITISSGMADDDLTRSLDIDTALPYSVSKAAMNTAVAKFSAQYRKSGILFLSISPGAVDTSDVALGTSDLSQSEFRCQ